MPFSFTRNYDVDPELDLDSLDITPHPLGVGYRDARANAEFARYINLRFVVLAAGIFMLIPMLILPIVGVVAVDGTFFQPLMATFGGINAVLVGIDSVLLFHPSPWSALRARARGWVAGGYIVTAIVLCFAMPVATYRCVDGATIVDRDVSVGNLHEECIDTVYPLTVLAMATISIIMVLPVILSVPAMLACIAATFGGHAAAAAALDLPFPLTAGEACAHSLVYVAVGAICVVVGQAQYAMTQRGFEQALESDFERRRATRQAENVDNLLARTLPKCVVRRLLSGDGAATVVDESVASTAFCADMAGFTAWSASRHPKAVVGLLSVLTADFDSAATSFDVEKLQTVGDSYVAICGIPRYRPDHASCAASFALAFQAIVRRVRATKPDEWGDAIRFRVGIATGPAVGGVLGTSRLAYEAFGRAMDEAQACETHGEPDRVVCTEATYYQLSTNGPWVITLRGQIAGDLQVFNVDPSGAPVEPPKSSSPYASRHGSMHVSTVSGGRRMTQRRQTGWSPEQQVRAAPTEDADEEEDPDAFVIREAVSMSIEINEADERHQTAAPAANNTTLMPGALDSSSTGAARSAASTLHASSANNAAGSVRFVRASSVDGGQSQQASSYDGVHSAESGPEVFEFDNDLAAVRRAFAASRYNLTQSRANDDSRSQTSRRLSRVLRDGASTGFAAPTAGTSGVEDHNLWMAEQTRRFTEPRFCCGVYTLADRDAEEEYLEFATGETQWNYATSRGALAAIAAVVIVAMPIADDEPNALGGSLVGLGVAITLILLALRKYVADVMNVVAQYAVCGMILGGVTTLPSSSSSTDPTYLMMVFALLVPLGTPGMPAMFSIPLQAVALAVPCIVVNRDSPLLAATLSLAFATIFLLNIHRTGSEKRLRQQCLDIHVAQLELVAQHDREHEQRDLLYTIVPEHVVGRLVNWVARDTPADDPVHDLAPLVAVGFISLHRIEPQDVDKTATSNSSEDGSMHAATHAMQWLFRAHATLDGVLSLYTDEGLFEKVKVVGDAVMLAGPFGTQSNSTADDGSGSYYDELGDDGGDDADYVPPLSRACIAMLNFSHALTQQVLEDGSAIGVSAGFHVGPVVACVLGRSRLCFDILGDTVNVAARTRTAARARESSMLCGPCAVTHDFYYWVLTASSASRRHGMAHDLASMPDDVLIPIRPSTIEAKGKGTIDVHAFDLRPSSTAVSAAAHQH